MHCFHRHGLHFWILLRAQIPEYVRIAFADEGLPRNAPLDCFAVNVHKGIIEPVNDLGKVVLVVHCIQNSPLRLDWHWFKLLLSAIKLQKLIHCFKILKDNSLEGNERLVAFGLVWRHLSDQWWTKSAILVPATVFERY